MKKSILSLAVLLTACAAPAEALVLTQQEKEIATYAFEKANSDCRDNGNYVACNARAIIGGYLVKNNVCFESRSANHQQAWRACTAEEKKFDISANWYEEGGPAVSAPKLTAAFLQGKRARYDGPMADVFSTKRCGPSDGPFFDGPIQLYGNFLYADGQPNTLVLPWTHNVVLIAAMDDPENYDEEDGPVSYMLAELC